jgi:hypothetical protein
LGYLKERKLLGKPTHRWKDNIKTDFEKYCTSVDWMQLAKGTVQCRSLVTIVTHPDFINVEIFLAKKCIIIIIIIIIIFSCAHRTLLHGT